MTLWQQRLAEYRAAKARADEADRWMSRAELMGDKLAKRMDEERAYFIAGVNFADRRSLRASAEMRAALTALKEAVRDAPVRDRLKAAGVVLCAHVPRAANDC